MLNNIIFMLNKNLKKKQFSSVEDPLPINYLETKQLNQ